MTGPIVATRAGRLRGELRDGISTFKGIPYGAPTSGPARFLPPSPAEPWDDVRDATAFGMSAPQAGLDLGDNPIARELTALVGSDSLVDHHQGEDCLVLNVWTPSVPGDGAARPVMVWLHGGEWLNSSGSVPMTDGANLARRGDVVVVTLNHRLGAPGYLYLGALDDRFAHSGNAGLLDLVAALDWVRDNIAEFGGDAGNVTIFGDSGGGQKTCALLATRRAQGLFHKAIVQSGPMLRFRTVEAASATTDAVLKKLGLKHDAIDALLAMPVGEIIAAQSAVLQGSLASLGSGHGLAPVLDERTLFEHPFDPVGAPSVDDIPLLIGTTKDEGTLFTAVMDGFDDAVEPFAKMLLGVLVGNAGDALYEAYLVSRPGATPADIARTALADYARVGSIRTVERRAAATATPAYMYLFSYETDALSGRLGATHGLDVPFVFDNVDFVPLTGTREERHVLAGAMADAWIAFARTGDPNTPALPAWPAYDATTRSTMILDVESSVVDDPSGTERAAWDAVELRM